MRLRLDGRQAPHARKRPLYRPSTRRWQVDKLLDAVREQVIAADRLHGFTVAEIATVLRAKRGLVHQCFHKLNLEGLMFKTGRNVPEEVLRRGPPNHYSGWLDTIYTKR